MSETVPDYVPLFRPGAAQGPDAAARDRIVLTLWPKGYKRQGQIVHPLDPVRCPNPTLLNLEISDAELLFMEWSRVPQVFEQVAAESIRTALYDWNRAITVEDICNAED